jgi:calcineurin-like phosphoesterase family protein
MDHTIIDNFNDTVEDQDTVYFLGDFTYGQNKERIEERLKELGYKDGFMSLKGRWTFIQGNHDNVKYFGESFRQLIRKGGSDYPITRQHGTIILPDIKEIKVDMGGENKQKIILCHYPLMTWEGMAQGAWHCFGHQHNGGPKHPATFAVNVCIELWDYKPVSISQIKECMTKRYMEKGMIL